MSLQLPEPSTCTSSLSSLLCNGNRNTSCCGDNSHFIQQATDDHRNERQSIIIDDSDVSLAKELNELTLQERDRILDDIHGVAKTPIEEETTSFIKSRIKDMDFALSNFPKNKRKALNRAIFLCPSIMNNLKFKLMFLRAELYNGPKAAKRFVKYFEEKLILFGESKLAKEITLDDLQSEDLDVLDYMGCILLPQKDNTGRPIWWIDIPGMDYDNRRVDSLLRCLWYQVMVSVTNDDKAQLKGICNIAYCPGNFLKEYPSILKMSSKWVKRSNEMNLGFPCRVTAFHFCYDDVSVRNILHVIRGTFGKEIRLRTRGHFGSDVEMQYSLMTFGICCNGLFRGENNESQRRAIQNQYLDRRRRIEDEESKARETLESTTCSVLYPKPEDVLFGRGVPYREYCGSKRFGKLVDSLLSMYCRCNDKFSKTCMTMDVVKTVQSYGGRFLERKGGEFGDWKIIDDVSARERVAISFRSRFSKLSLPADGGNAKIRMARPQSISSGIMQSSGNKHPRATKRLRCDELI